jgi:hypothetical protein
VELRDDKEGREEMKNFLVLKRLLGYHATGFLGLATFLTIPKH